MNQDSLFQIITCSTAILKQHPTEVVPLLLQRGLARTLLSGSESDAISDYLRAYLKDKQTTIEVSSFKRDKSFAIFCLLRHR